jgi:AcrR family transcriptional regulator
MSVSQNIKDPIREEILRGATELFERYGFKKTTMEDIARQIGKSKSALYYYYKTKEEIFEAVVLQEIDKQRMEASAAMKKVETAPEKFRILFTSLLAGVKEKANKFSLFRAEVYENPFLLNNTMKLRDSYVEEQLRDILILGISRQEVKMMNSSEIGLWAKMVNLTMRSLGSKLFLEDDWNISKEQLAFLADTLFQGVAR